MTDMLRGPLDYYNDAGARELAHRLKDKNDLNAIEYAAKMMAKRVVSNAVLIPMPGRNGYAESMLTLANKIAEISGAKVANILVGRKRKSLYDVKKKGINPSINYLGLTLKEEAPGCDNIFIIDNVIATGLSMRAATRLIPNAIPLSFAQDMSFISIKTVINL